MNRVMAIITAVGFILSGFYLENTYAGKNKENKKRNPPTEEVAGVPDEGAGEKPANATFVLPEAERPVISENHKDWMVEVKPVDKAIECGKRFPAFKGAEMSFYVSKFETTQKLWETVMGNNPSQFKGQKNLPVEMASFYEMAVFCNKLSKKDGFTPCYYTDEAFTQEFVTPGETGDEIYWKRDADGYRMPTGNEWVYAAKGGEFDSGHEIAGANKKDADLVAWFEKNAEKKTHPVGLKKPNELGLYDMAGNVFELCWGTFQDKKYSCLRHGSGFMGSASRCGITNRRGSGFGGKQPDEGFRLFRNRPIKQDQI